MGGRKVGIISSVISGSVEIAGAWPSVAARSSIDF